MPESNIKIEFANSDDVNALSALSIGVWLHTYATRGVVKSYADFVLTEFAPEKFLQHLQDANQIVLKCELEGNLLGYLRAHMDTKCPGSPSVKCEVTTLYVQERYQNSGIGTRLLERLDQNLRGIGIDTYWLSVNAQNARAILFYQKRNFKRIGSIYFPLDGSQHENFVMLKLSQKVSGPISYRRMREFRRV
ncbi:ribosomal protein S18 acetylase RimI-like enzyme [Rhizobium sp. SJZ105]|uniref:GNAT family N-acetyltransferase n=1 Tax=Rhizobium sp. SJZ105 TaxID=2572678 RepID=UPI0011A66BC8|nr:ribosomal protein S18 acetylase RimI-like enzyme [Rhizobium sp. SJZ105]